MIDDVQIEVFDLTPEVWEISKMALTLGQSVK